MDKLFYVLLVFSIVFGLVFHPAGMFYKGDTASKKRYQCLVSIVVAATTIIALVIGIALKIRTGEIRFVVIYGLFLALDIICVWLNFGNFFRPDVKRSLERLEPFFKRVKALDEKDSRNLLYEYILTRDRSLEKELVSDGWCSEIDIKELRSIFKGASKKDVKKRALLLILEEANKREQE